MTKQEALELTSFKNYCTCGGYAWSMYGGDPMRPHASWCPQFEEYNEWAQALGRESVVNFVHPSQRKNHE